MRSVQEDGEARPASPVSGTSPWGKVAATLAVVGIALVGAVFFFADEDTREWLYSFGFVVLLLAAVAAVTNRVRGRGERLALLPGTALGWWAVALIVGVALGVVAGQIQATGQAENDLLEDTTLVVGLASGVVAIVAVLKRGERSIPVVVLALVPVMSVPYFLFGELALAL